MVGNASLSARRLLVVKLATLGDLLTATPALRALRDAYPSAHIGVLTTPGSAPLLRGLETVDEVISFDKFAFDAPSGAVSALPRAVELGARLRAGGWQALLLLHHLTTAFGTLKYAALAVGSGAPVRAGLDNGRGRLFLTRAARDLGFGWKHEADYWLDVAGQVGARRPASPRLEVALAPEDRAWAEAQRSPMAGQRVALFSPGSGAFSPARRWPAPRFAGAARRVRDRLGLAPAILCGVAPDEQALARSIQADVPGARLIPSAPSPQALAAYLRTCEVVVANDSGPVHLAAAVGTPVVAIFGPTNERAWGPYPAREPRNQVVREQLACAPCVHRGHAFGTPGGCAARTCLALIEPAAVADAVARAVAAGRAETEGAA